MFTNYQQFTVNPIIINGQIKMLESHSTTTATLWLKTTATIHVS